MSGTPEAVTFVPIGVLRTEHDRPEATPIQPRFARGARGRAELRTEYAPALADLDGFSHVILLYHLHRAGPFRPTVTPFMDATPRGLFATRAPVRPNPIGLSVVRLERIEGATLHLLDVDMLDGSPLLDIKPYVPRFEPDETLTGGWSDAVPEAEARRRGRRDWNGPREADA